MRILTEPVVPGSWRGGCGWGFQKWVPQKWKWTSRCRYFGRSRQSMVAAFILARVCGKSALQPKSRVFAWSSSTPSTSRSVPNAVSSEYLSSSACLTRRECFSVRGWVAPRGRGASIQFECLCIMRHLHSIWVRQDNASSGPQRLCDPWNATVGSTDDPTTPRGQGANEEVKDERSPPVRTGAAAGKNRTEGVKFETKPKGKSCQRVWVGGTLIARAVGK